MPERFSPERKEQTALAAYSKEFQDLVAERGMETLLKDCHFDGPFEEWVKERQFIVDAIDRDGTLLDIGCANGFLLKCLEEWSEHEIDPYGFDTDATAIEKAKGLYPKKEGQFATVSDPEAQKNFPQNFDMIYWNVWDNVDFDDAYIQALLKKSLESVDAGGRLILGFYHPEQEENERRIKQLDSIGYAITQVDVPGDLPERVVVIEKVQE